MTNRSKATTHADDCWSWGPKHYECAVREIERLREKLSKMRAAEPSDEEIDAIAASMADGAGGMLKQCGYRQFARALLACYGAQPVTRTEPSSGLGTIEYSVQAPETTKAFSDPAVRAAWTLGSVSDTQPKRRLYNASGSLSEYGVFPECDAQQSTASSETVNVVGMPEFDGLLDHIYEYGTEAEGVIEKANAFARAVIARYSPQQPTEIERNRLATTLQAEVEALRAEVDGTIRELLAERDALREDAARYRWLRKGESDDIAVVRGLGAMDYGMSAVIGTYSEEIDGDDLDAAIDAAMRKEGKQ